MQIRPVLINEGAVQIAVRAESGDNEGDLFQTVEIGGEGFGYSFDELIAAARNQIPLEWPRE